MMKIRVIIIMKLIRLMVMVMVMVTSSDHPLACHPHHYDHIIDWTIMTTIFVKSLYSQVSGPPENDDPSRPLHNLEVKTFSQSGGEKFPIVSKSFQFVPSKIHILLQVITIPDIIVRSCGCNWSVKPWQGISSPFEWSCFILFPSFLMLLWIKRCSRVDPLHLIDDWDDWRKEF